MDAGCPFCSLDRPEIASTALAVAVSDGYPVSPGHALVIPRRHAAAYFDYSDEEQRDIWRLVDQVRAILDEAHQPDGFNIGINVGVAAGQTIMHCHIHVIPRYLGDTENPRGGVRHCIPGKGDY